MQYQKKRSKIKISRHDNFYNVSVIELKVTMLGNITLYFEDLHAFPRADRALQLGEIRSTSDLENMITYDSNLRRYIEAELLDHYSSGHTHRVRISDIKDISVYVSGLEGDLFGGSISARYIVEFS